MSKLGGNFMNDYEVNKTYERWINGPTLFGHAFDRQRFYTFISACVYYVTYMRFVKREIAWKEIRKEYLVERLKKDLVDIRHAQQSELEQIIHEVICNFETLIEYETCRIHPSVFSLDYWKTFIYPKIKEHF